LREEGLVSVHAGQAFGKRHQFPFRKGQNGSLLMNIWDVGGVVVVYPLFSENGV
jgi:hypothetical protein